MGVEFVRGDVRDLAALTALGAADLVIDCAAEPSVRAGYAGGARELIDLNLGGTHGNKGYFRPLQRETLHAKSPERDVQVYPGVCQ
jgi:hypothetical protein